MNQSSESAPKFELSDYQTGKIILRAIEVNVRDARLSDPEAKRWLLEDGYHWLSFMLNKHIDYDQFFWWVSHDCMGKLKTNKPLYLVKMELIEKRGYRCECCGLPQTYLEAHHVFIHRSKRHPELDCPQNIQLVCQQCHMSGRADSKDNFDNFWTVQSKRYDMEQWKLSLPLKIKLKHTP